jgi:hypothetical protein
MFIKSTITALFALAAQGVLAQEATTQEVNVLVANFERMSCPRFHTDWRNALSDEPNPDFCNQRPTLSLLSCQLSALRVFWT